ncbi:uncharacterized protein LOC110931350 [Helianthus annuus]|uniref:uncharacterized protein LOC110931350 n=1 Tax=Helianthus annuus TaxID=4232 RepID=UPI000B8EFCEC|nr:uncharacterized protein LOC110931350 [Helianthus annuus]
MAIPNPNGDGFIKETMYVEYEWNPLRCLTCCVFGHSNDSCLKNPRKAVSSANQKNVRQPGNQGSRMTQKGQAVLLQLLPMVCLATWNIRGLNRPLKQTEVRQVVRENGVSFCAVLESHVEVSKLDKVCRSVFSNWEWTSNGGQCDKGTRIIIGWNTDVFDIMVLAQTSQVIHVQMIFKRDKKVIFYSIVYASNSYITRRELWSHLARHKILVANNPWVIMGNFNSALNLEDKSMGASGISTSMRDFQECVNEIEVADIKSIGFHFTWNQKPKKGVGLLKKIDRAMGNIPFVSKFPKAVALFQPYRVFDHCPCILKINKMEKKRANSFKFANFLVHKPGFMDIVKSNWDLSIMGVHQFRLVKKLRALKTTLRSLLYKQGNLHKKVDELRGKLDAIQREVEKHPFDENIRSEEANATREFQEASLDEERF